MNFTIKSLEIKNIAYVTTSGDMSGHDYLAMAKELLQQQKLMPNNNVIFDHRELSFENVSFLDIESIRKFHRENEQSIGSGKSAIIVKIGMSSAWKRLWERGEKIKTSNVVKIFEDYEAAIRWATSNI